MTFRIPSLISGALLSLSTLSFAGMLSNADFNQGSWTTAEDPQGDWSSIAADGSLAPHASSNTENYGASDTPNLTSVAAHLKANGGNAIRQTLHHVDAGTFSQISVGFNLGYRREEATNGDLTLRVSLLDPTDGTVFTHQDVTVTDPGVGANALAAQNLTLTVDTTTYAGRPIAVQFTNVTDLGGAAWSGTMMIDDVDVNPVTAPVAAEATTTTAVRNVINRLISGRGTEFTFEMIAPDAGRDVFEIEAGPTNTVVIRGNRTLTLVSGFNWYLKHTAHCHASWSGNQLNLASPAPAPVGVIRQVSPYIHRNQGNVTAASYSQAYWDWARWEKEIDLMALNGITQAVVVPGHQKVWQETLLRHGYSQADIDAYIPNLGHTCWWLFGNLEGDGGPLPQDVIDGEAVLGLQIANRMRELGIEPIVFGFVGLVPNTFRNYYPSAYVIDQGNWLNYLRPDVLSPLDAQFAPTAAIWYEELANVFGDVKFLAGDLFHEGGSSGGLNLTTSAEAVQDSMLASLPESTWLVQSWGGNPDAALVAGTDLHHTIVQQLISNLATGEGEGGGLRTYQGRPWTWNEVSNFGGNNGLYGNLQVLADLPNLLLTPTNLERFSGIGIFMEAIELNPIYTDLLTDMIWRTTPPDLNTWLNDLTRRRYGAANTDAQQAWALLRDSVYDLPIFQFGVTDFVIGARPGPNVFRAREWGDNARYWNPWEVTQAAEKMLAAAPTLGSGEAFRFDLIDILRQTLNDYTFAVYKQMMAAYNSGNSAQFEIEAARLLTAFDHLDALLGTYSQWTIGSWITDARAKSTNAATKELMESNARQIVTTWTQVDNPGLNDYASRSRSGLVGDYYKQRWSIYIGDLRDALAGSGSGNYSGASFEHNWRDDRSVSYTSTPSGDTITVANQLWAAIGADIVAEAEAVGRWGWSLTNGGATETFTWDVTELISNPTRLAVLFDYQSGTHALQIDKLELLRNGNPIGTGTSSSYASADIPKSISASGTPTITSTIDVPAGAGIITDVNVSLDIAHTFDSDLDITLIHPDGTRIGLSFDNGGNGDNYTNTVFDQEPGTSITAGSAPFTGTFVPEESLDTLNGEPATGTWTLEVHDDANADGGTLNSWSLEFNSGAVGPDSPIDTHNGRTGTFDTDHAYSLAFTSAHTPGDTYTLRATVSGDGGGSSNGIIHVTAPGHVTDESFIGRYRRYSVVIGQHDTLDLNADYSLQHYSDGTPTNTYDNHSWQQTNGLLTILDGSSAVVSYHTLTTADSLTNDDGMMHRLAIATSVTEWAQSIGLTSPDDTPSADPDADTLTNSMEMALGTDPQAFTGESVTHAFTTNADTLTFSFSRPILYQTIGFGYTLQQSATLTPNSWSAAPMGNIVVTPHPTDNTLEVVTITAPVSGTSGFFRLNVAE